MQVRRSARTCGLAALGMVLAVSRIALGQATNQITALEPDAAPQGTTNLLVTFTLDTDAPPAPPAGVMPDSVLIGAMTGNSVTHPSQYIVTARFDIPSAEPTGAKDAAINFTTPNGTLIFSKAGGFTVTAGTNLPPSIAQQPQSRTVPPGGSVTFTIGASGTPPLAYQWQKNECDIGGATGTTYTIDPVAEPDAGNYRCVVTNDYGTATSDEAVLTVAELPIGAYPVVDTSQGVCYDNTAEIVCPEAGTAFHGQDAQYAGHSSSYALSADGLTVYDNITGLTWQRSPDTNGDGSLDSNDKFTWAEAQAYPGTLNAQTFGGYDDWRLPTIKELYSLIDFRGTDPSGCGAPVDCPDIVPFIDTGYFEFAYGDISAGERLIDSQYASSTLYVATPPSGTLLFGVNFADGRIKGYGLTAPDGGQKTFFVICVHGSPDYGVNNFFDNGDGTVTDRATGLMWQQADSGYGMFWADALAYAEGLTLAGYDDWRLPDAKELQSIVDYTRCPDTTGSAATDPAFSTSAITNEAGQVDYPYYWASTTHANWTAIPGPSAAYVAFGRAMGYMNGVWQDVHGAGAQRSDPKEGDPAEWPYGHGPQGDAIRIFNYVRAVRPAPAPRPGDLNCDGTVNFGDINPFVLTLVDSGLWQQTYPGCPLDNGDINGDGCVGFGDINPFVALLTGR
jgi:hypothetical protein